MGYKNAIEGEKLLEKKLGDNVKRIGGWSIKLLPYLVTGLPDRLCLFPGGRVMFAEIKTTGQKARPSQELIHSKLRALGFRVEVIDNTEQILTIIKEYERE